MRIPQSIAISERRGLIHFEISNGMAVRSYPLETHVSNHCLTHDNLRDCLAHVTVSVNNQEQHVEYLIDSITCSDMTLQAATGLICKNKNSMLSKI